MDEANSYPQPGMGIQNKGWSTMYDKLKDKARKLRKLITRTRREFPEIARQTERNLREVEKQIDIARKGQPVR